MKVTGAIKVREKILEWAKLKEWTQSQLAEALGSHDSEIANWFSDKNPRHPSWQMLRKICLLTGFDIGDILTFDRNIAQED